MRGAAADSNKYQQRFKKWGSTKNLKKEERDRLLQQMESGEYTVDCNLCKSNIDRRLRRHDPAKWRDIQSRKADKQNSGYLYPISGTSVDSNTQYDSSFSYSTLSGTQASAGVNISVRADPPSLNDQSLFAPQSCSKDSPDAKDSADSALRPRPDREVIKPTMNNAFWTLSRSGEWLLTDVSSPSPSPLLPTDPKDFDLGHVLGHVRSFSEWQLSNPSQDAELDNTMSSTSVTHKNFWRNMQHCIYLFKLDDINRAMPILSQLCSSSSEVMLNPSLEFVRNLFTSFSPVNFRVHPNVRTKLLSHFIKMAKKTLGHKHSVTVICQQLLKDEDTRDTTERALICMHSLMVRARSSMVFDTERSIIALLRRDKVLDSASEMASGLFASSKAAFRSGSAEVRDAAMEMAHVCMDKGGLEDLNTAKIFCMMRVGSAVARDGLIGHQYHDTRTIWALEDLAKIEELLGAYDRGAIWLEDAAETSKDVGDPIAMTHILDKLERVLRLCGKDDDARIIKFSYARFTWTPQMGVLRS